LVEAGAHTKTHPELSRLPAATQRDEIIESKKMLENLLGRPIDQFAYPFGNYDTDTVKIVREAGFTSACSVNCDSVWPDPDLFQLPRVTVEDCNGDEFTNLLKQVLN
jgi:peptidoglycan/xylan/chitin deacetylase (PgdA/CDA1 family)